VRRIVPWMRPIWSSPDTVTYYLTKATPRLAFWVVFALNFSFSVLGALYFGVLWAGRGNVMAFFGNWTNPFVHWINYPLTAWFVVFLCKDMDTVLSKLKASSLIEINEEDFDTIWNSRLRPANYVLPVIAVVIASIVTLWFRKAGFGYGIWFTINPYYHTLMDSLFWLEWLLMSRTAAN